VAAVENEEGATPFPPDAFWWTDGERPWWAKLRRAGAHIDALSSAIRDFERSGPWEVVEERDEQPNVVAFRLQIYQEPPSDLSTLVGDAVHNIRSALDSVAYGLAERHLGALSGKQEQATSFPIHEDEAAFRKWSRSKSSGITVVDLYGEQGIVALESVQPFSLGVEAERHGVDRGRARSDDLKSDAGYRLNELWKIDKHRRLPRLAWFYKGMGCFGESGACRQVLPNRSRELDGQLLARHRLSPAEGARAVSHAWDVDLMLADDPFPFPVRLIAALDRWRSSVGGWMIPRVFTTAMTGGPPPILIPGGWPF
jgi:hypothetical protein